MTTQSLNLSISQSPDLYALVIRLAAATSTTLRATQGQLAHAAFLNILSQADPALTQSLHDYNGRKPFTLSQLEGFGRGRDGQHRINAGQEGWLRVTLLDPDLFQTFIQYFLRGRNQATIHLNPATFHISEILSNPQSHSLAGYNTLAHLHTQWQEVSLDQRQHHTIQLNFRSPTAFSLRGPEQRHRHMHILPDPALVFGELAGYWDRLTGYDTQDDIREFAAVHVVVARHQIETHMFQYTNGKQVGFTGDVSFQILEPDPVFIRHLNLLADLVFYTGIGSKTTMGMGQVMRR
jgi:CRISPR-associated endoribonuclease Cas6